MRAAVVTTTDATDSPVPTGPIRVGTISIADAPQMGADLAAIVAAWPTLPQNIRAAVLALVQLK